MQKINFMCFSCFLKYNLRQFYLFKQEMTSGKGKLLQSVFDILSLHFYVHNPILIYVIMEKIILWYCSNDPDLFSPSMEFQECLMCFTGTTQLQ